MPRINKYNINSKESGIYLIRNNINNKVYVGSAKKLLERLSNHFHLLKNNKHHSIHLQNAWNKYGEKCFSHEIIEIVTDLNSLIDREQIHIDKNNSSCDKYGYNICPLAKNNLGVKQTRGLKKRSQRMTGSGNHFYNKKHSEKSKYYIGLNNHIRKLNNVQIEKIKNIWKLNLYTQQKLAELFNVTQPHISKIINNKRRKKFNYVPTTN